MNTSTSMDRQTALETANRLMMRMEGLRRNRDYRTIQNDLLMLADALQDAADANKPWIMADQCENSGLTDETVVHVPGNNRCLPHCPKCGQEVSKHHPVEQGNIRSTDREHAKEQIRAKYPEARFSR